MAVKVEDVKRDDKLRVVSDSASVKHNGTKILLRNGDIIKLNDDYHKQKDTVEAVVLIGIYRGLDVEIKHDVIGQCFVFANS